MTTLTDISSIHITRLQDGLWNVDFRCRDTTVYEEFAHTPEAAITAAKLALERFRDDTRPGADYYPADLGRHS